ncbi:MAG: uracil-DNA glycosylase [Bdellovibrionaceae bacterium]|nr:uracil-DNA glycosylase [Pseudobdellovibrionaceae bacterium]MDW8190145.1 uracil-DNA glycosylase [Pseudobdellovibrionaceae bacterium]
MLSSSLSKHQHSLPIHGSHHRAIDLPPCWLTMLESFFHHQQCEQLRQFLISEKRMGKIIYPPSQQIFRAFHLTPFDQVKVVIIGQDPYHGPGQAHGLCFSVPEGIPWPPSLKNIFLELSSDLNVPMPTTGDLSHWAKQGVLLLNAVLTVEANKPASHQNKGWEALTDLAIAKLNENKSGLVFILWGSFAQKKKGLIDPHRHLIIESAHPSPLSAHRGFFGSKPFSKTNEFLIKQGLTPIDWTLTSKVVGPESNPY